MKTQPVMRSLAVRQIGLSLVEMMIAMTLSLMLLAGLVTYFVNASTNQREMQASAIQIENGRYALDTLVQGLRLAGFYGSFSAYTTPTSLPDPCSTNNTDLLNAMGMPVQGVQAASMSSAPVAPSGCASLLTSGNLAVGSDILVIRFAEPSPVAIGSATTSGDKYLQENPISATVMTGGSTINCSMDPTGAAATITRKCSIPFSVDRCESTCTGGGSPAGDIRKMNVHIYFVAPCSVPASGSLCTGSTDDGGNPVPTLKRIELTSSGFSIVPVAEGVEYMKLTYGIDASPSAVNASTGFAGDGVPDTYKLTPALADFANTVSIRVDLLVRNTQQTPGYTNSKTYSLGVDPSNPAAPAYTIGPFSDRYRRHVYAAETRLVNLSARREIP